MLVNTINAGSRCSLISLYYLIAVICLSEKGLREGRTHGQPHATHPASGVTALTGLSLVRCCVQSLSKGVVVENGRGIVDPKRSYL